MTSLRTMEGLDLNVVEDAVGNQLRTGSRKFIERGLMAEEKGHLKLTKRGKIIG